jgi:hypothetical protein
VSAERILIAVSKDITDAAKPSLKASLGGIEIVSVSDGVRGLTAFVKLLRVRQAPLLVVLDSSHERLPGTRAARAMRAVERGFGVEAVPIMFYTVEAADESMRGTLSQLGRAVHLRRPEGVPIGDQATRMTKAIVKLLQKVRG